MGRYDGQPRCPVIGKISYPTRKAARKHRNHLAASSRKTGRARRGIFKCGWCWQYHIGRARGQGGGRA